MLHDSTYMRYAEWSNSSRWKVGGWLPGAGGEMEIEELVFNGHRVLVFQDEKS